jgi:phage repressor protein C with HTH and peptisase S24 domain
MEPGYQHGDIIFVDPDVTPAHGKDVAVRLDACNEVVFKRLVIECNLNITQNHPRRAHPNEKGAGCALLFGLPLTILGDLLPA